MGRSYLNDLKARHLDRRKLAHGGAKPQDKTAFMTFSVTRATCNVCSKCDQFLDNRSAHLLRSFSTRQLGQSVQLSRILLPTLHKLRKITIYGHPCSEMQAALMYI